MIYVMGCSIQIGKAKLSEVHKITIENSIKQLSDTCTIEIPTAYVQEKGNKKLSEVVQVGDFVEVKLGYNANKSSELHQEFVGYIKMLKYDTPFKIECEDEMYILRKMPANKGSYENLQLSSFLIQNGLSPQKFKILFDSFMLSKFVVNEGWSLYDVLFELKKDPYNLYAYYHEGLLHIGFAYDVRKDSRTKTYRLSEEKNVVSHSLEYMTSEGKKVRVLAVSNKSNGEKETIEVGDAEGTLRTLNFGEMSKIELKKQAEENLKKMKFSGYEGKITAFGYPLTRAGDSVHLIDKKYKDREGKYLVDEVKIDFSSKGYRREINISYRI